MSEVLPSSYKIWCNFDYDEITYIFVYIQTRFYLLNIGSMEEKIISELRRILSSYKKTCVGLVSKVDSELFIYDNNTNSFYLKDLKGNIVEKYEDKTLVFSTLVGSENDIIPKSFSQIDWTKVTRLLSTIIDMGDLNFETEDNRISYSWDGFFIVAFMLELKCYEDVIKISDTHYFTNSIASDFDEHVTQSKQDLKETLARIVDDGCKYKISFYDDNTWFGISVTNKTYLPIINGIEEEIVRVYRDLESLISPVVEKVMIHLGYRIEDIKGKV